MITFVYPYLERRAEGHEILYSIRSLCKNFKSEFNIFIIGDKPKWYNGKFIECYDLGTRALDIIDKLKRAINSKFVTEDFIFIHDDNYLISEIDNSFFDKVIAEAHYTLLPTNGQGSWHKLLNNTISVLLPLVDVYNYETHIPRKYNKKKIFEVIKHYKLDRNLLLHSTLYFNEFFDKPDVIMADENKIKCTIKTKMVHEAIKNLSIGKTWMVNNHGAYNDSFVRFLKNNFSEKCKYEI